MSSDFHRNEYYSRQIALSELGPNGQDQLRRSKATLVGLGGLGSITALYLTLAGVGQLTLIDQDTVELNNLHRQAIYSLSDIRHPKVEVAASKLAKVNPDVKLISIADNVNEDNLQEIIGQTDCIVDGLDNMRTRYLLNRYSVEHQIPFVFGGAIGLEGNVAVFKPPTTPCLECVLPGLQDSNLVTCDTRGVLGATTGIIGSLQALETIKVLAGINRSFETKLMLFDFAQSEFRSIPLRIRKDCPVCQVKQKSTPIETKLAWLCGSNTVNVNPEHPLTLDLNNLNQLLAKHCKILLTTPVVLVIDYHGHEISIFKKGRTLIKNVESEQDALKLYREVNKIIEG
ncbi:MAG TPA: HesA/MoeB/ThiF family protein [Candidatus Bathyarchaeia archaeon]|nr:HesA/MoeB/ThiF family protein [Candidatus Bathyarchaeia archaeon]